MRIVDLRFQGAEGVIGSFLFRHEDELGLVETGPTTTLPVLQEALEEAGGLEKLTTVVVTHIHLDHAGAVGNLLARAPHARCHVHAIGAPHLIDPTNLLRSATRIYGDQMDSLWGEVRPAPENRVVPIADGDVVRLPGANLEVVYTPGHASHHIALHWAEVGAVFTGDVAGVRLQGSKHIRPPTPPPDIDLRRWRESVDRLRRLNPQTLYLTHYGAHSVDIGSHFSSVLMRLEDWSDLLRQGLSRGQGAPELVDALRRRVDGEVLAEGGDLHTVRRYELATPTGMNVDGLTRYLRKFEDVTGATA